MRTPSEQLKRAVEAAERDPDGGKVLLGLDAAKKLLAQIERPPSADLKTLEAAARAAMPGPWVAVQVGDKWEMRKDRAEEGWPKSHEEGKILAAANAAYLSIAHPQTILSLLSRIAELEEGLNTSAEKFRSLARALARAGLHDDAAYADRAEERVRSLLSEKKE